MTSDPIKIGFVGLSPGRWASYSHLPAIQSLPNKYKLTAITNSSLTSSRNAVKNIFPEDSGAVKAFGSVEDMVKNGDVDLVAVSVKVPGHYDAVMKALEAGKDVVCEWPLGRNLEEAREMWRKSEERGVRTAVGLQGRGIGVFKKAKELISQGKIGDILSTNIRASNSFGAGKLPESMAYFLDPSSGASYLSITALHILDTALYVLSSKISSITATTATRFPTIQLLAPSGESKPVTTTIADQVLIHATLAQSGAPLSYHSWSDPVAKASFVWRVSGTKGWLEFRGDSALFLIKDEPRLWFGAGGDEEEEVLVDVEKGKDGGNVRGLWEDFGDKGDDGMGMGRYADFGEAVERHKVIEAVLRSAKEGVRVEL